MGAVRVGVRGVRLIRRRRPLRDSGRHVEGFHEGETYSAWELRFLNILVDRIEQRTDWKLPALSFRDLVLTE